MWFSKPCWNYYSIHSSGESIRTVWRDACYVEANKHEHIKTLAGYYHVEKNDKLKKIHFDGVDMFFDDAMLLIILEMQYKFCIMDYGVLGMNNIQDYSENDIQIICAGAKTWEMSNIVKTNRMLDKPGNTNFIFNFVLQAEREEIKQLMAQHTDRVFFFGLL